MKNARGNITQPVVIADVLSTTRRLRYGSVGVLPKGNRHSFEKTTAAEKLDR